MLELRTLEDRDQYIRILDSLARFYNSQSVGHIGYMLASAAIATTVLFQIYSLTRSSLEEMLRMIFIPSGISTPVQDWGATLSVIAIFVFLFIVYFLGSWPFSFRYQFARTQYYIVLTELAWDHMGASQPNKTSTNQGVDGERFDKFEIYKKRADHMGINQAIMRLFEARLYLSICRRQKKNDEKELEKQTENVATLFEAQGEICPAKWHGEPATYYSSSVWFWHKTDLLRLAYRRHLKEDLQGSKDGTPHKIAELLLGKSS